MMEQRFSMSSSIKQKVRRAFLVLVSVTVALSLVISVVAMLALRARNKTTLIDQAVSSAGTFAKGQSETISEQLAAVKGKIEQTARFTEYVYTHQESFRTRPIPTPDDINAADYPGGVVDNVLHWLPFEKQDASDPAVVAEADLLTALEPELESVIRTCPMIVSLYVATNTHVNIGYDSAVLSKQGLGAYDPVDAGAVWYNTVMGTETAYISDAYTDTFGRGLTVTVAEPYFVDGAIRGVIGADIVIENINESILNFDTGSKNGYAMLFSAMAQPLCAAEMTDQTTSAQLLGGEEYVSLLQTQNSGEYAVDLNGNEVYVVFDTVKTTGWKLAVVLDKDTIVAPANRAALLIVWTILVLVGINGMLFAVMWFVIRRQSGSLVRPILTLTDEVARIGAGELDYKSEIHTGDEIETLSRGFEDMTVSLKKHIENLTAVTAEKERIGAELGVAAHIQSSMLPCIFPAFPDKDTFDIYATMNPAKEVGGDFYDFFMVDDRHVAIVMADVSGKGVPAALFMVIGKTLIKDHTAPGKDLGQVFTEVNELLCESNSEGLFITAFEGVLDLVTGEFVFVNAGHEMPFISKNGGAFAPYKIKAGFVLAGMEGMRYKGGSMILQPGDKIFQYTDGVTEATDAYNRLYGMERLCRVLATVSDRTPTEILPAVKADIDAFVGEAPQFDDITMLCLEYRKKMDE